MITKEMVDRINYLAKKSKGEGLTEEEKVEQQKLRREYIDCIKGQVRQQLESIEIVDGDKCSCGHHHEDGHHHKDGHHHDENCGCGKKH